MDVIIEKLLTSVLGGGPGAIAAILVAIIVWLFFERKRLLDELSRKDEKIEKIIDDYYKGNLTLAQALDSLKAVLYEIKGKLF